MSDYWLLPSKQFSAISQWEQVAFRWDDDEVHFVLYRQTCFKLDFYSASSLKQQCVDRHVTQLWHIILIPCQTIFALYSFNIACLTEKQQIPIW
jgi:hypothetical protein